MAAHKRHFKWCLQEQTRLQQVTPDRTLAQQHLTKARHNNQVMHALLQEEILDWAFTTGFYAVYHCFLSLLALHGYRSRNQSCTVTALRELIHEQEIALLPTDIDAFDALQTDLDVATIRQTREQATYGIHTTVGEDEITRVQELYIITRQEALRQLRNA